MPGYVMHLTEAELIMDSIRKRMPVPFEWKQQFLTGTLLPDTRLKDEKRYSHFWDPDHLELLALAPDLSMFLKKYGDRLMDPVILGYLAHLHLDACYVLNYWPTVIDFYGSEGEPEVQKQKITSVEIHHLHRQVPVRQFFSTEYYYGEYTKLNGYFIDKYHLSVPDWRQVRNFDMDEVRLEGMAFVCQELSCLIREYHTGDEGRIQIFDLDHLEEFIAGTAETFAEQYEDCLIASAQACGGYTDEYQV